MDISFVIPCYSSEKTIEIVVDEIYQLMSKHKKNSYEIILVNDCSPDSVYEVICNLSYADSHIKCIDFAKNFGQHSALMAGYRAARGDVVISVDDDGQIPVEQTFDLLNKLEDGHDVAYASFEKNTRGMFRGFGTKVNDVMANILLQKPKELQLTSFFAMKRFICDEIVIYDSPYPYIPGLVLRSTRKICNLSMPLRNRLYGKSGYSLKKLLSLWLNGFTAFSVKPLRMATVLGFICAAIGFMVGFYTIIHKLIYPMTPAGYSSLMAVLLFVSGIIMIILGLIGEYIGRIYICLNNSPQYVIRQTVNFDDEK